MFETIEAKAIAIVLLSVALLSGLWYVDHLGFVRGEAAIQNQWDEAKLKATSDALKTQQANDEKLNESEQNYAAQKKINDDLLAGKSSGMFYTPTVCPVSVPTSGKIATGANPASGTDRPSSGTVDLSEVEREVEQLGHDYDELAIRLNSIAITQKQEQ